MKRATQMLNIHAQSLPAHLHEPMHLNIHGDSIKTKQNCLCHIYLMPGDTILKLSRYLDN